MSAVTFLPEYIRFNPKSRSIHIVAACDRIKALVSISKDVIEYLADAKQLDQNASTTIVVKHKRLLESATEIAMRRLGGTRASVTVVLPDVLVAVNATLGTVGAETKKGAG